MLDRSPVSLFFKFIFSFVGIFYAGILAVDSNAPHIANVFLTLAAFSWGLSIITLKFFNKSFWWTGFFITYAGLTFYHF